MNHPVVSYTQEQFPRFVGMAALVLLFFLLNGLLLAGGGISKGGDAPRYISGAESLLAGQPLEGKQTSYLAYIAVVAFCQAVGWGLNGVVALQLVVGGLAASALYALARQRSGFWAGILAAGLLVGDLSIARWNFFILTDSLYISGMVLAVWAAWWASERHGYRYFAAALVVLAVSLLRPHGWILPPLVGIYWTWTGIADRRLRWLSVGVIVLVVILAVASVRGLQAGVEAEAPGEMLREGEVVWGYEAWRLPMPSDPALPSGSLIESVGYVLRHPLPTLELIGARLLANFANVRPYYSTVYNALILMWLLPIYALAVLGAIWTWKQPLTRLIVAIIAGHALIVALTFADWSGRFLQYSLPLVYLLSASAGVCVWRRTKTRLRLTGVVLALVGLVSLAVARGAQEYLPRKSAFFDGDPPSGAVARADTFAGQVRLIGFTPLATDHHPGRYASLTLYWQAVAHSPTDYMVTVQLVSAAGVRIAGTDLMIGSGSYPEIGASLWPVGARLAESYLLYIPADAPPVLDLIVALYDPRSGERLPLTAPDGTPTGEDRVRLGRLGLITDQGIPTLEGPVADVDYRLGDALHVTGFSLPQEVSPSGGLAVGVRIESTQPIYEDYVLFFHLLDGEGNLVAQSDSPTLSGDWTTAALIPGQPLGAIRVIDLPDDLPPGSYRLVMGMYSYPSLARLPVHDAAGNTLPDGLIEVGWVRIGG